MTAPLPAEPNDVGFAFFAWARLATNPTLMVWPGWAVVAILHTDWHMKELRGVIYGR